MSDDYMGALLEDIDGKLDAILESQAGLATTLQLTAVEERLTRVESEVVIIRKVLTEHSRQLHDHDTHIDDHEFRISDLEGDEPEYA